MTTTHTTATPLPFLLPAANLAIGDTTWAGIIDELETLPSGVIQVTFTDGNMTGYKPDFLIEVTRRRPLVALNDAVATLTALLETWDAREQLIGRKGPGDVWAVGTANTYGICASEVRTLLARLV